MSSGDDNDSSGQKTKKSEQNQAAVDGAQKASFQTAIEGPDEDVKIVKSSDPAALKSVEVVPVPDASQPKTSNDDAKNA